MVLADIVAGTFKTNTEIARDVARKHPYKQWLGRSRRLETLGASKGFLKAPLMTAADALKLQASSGALSHHCELSEHLCRCSPLLNVHRRLALNATIMLTRSET